MSPKSLFRTGCGACPAPRTQAPPGTTPMMARPRDDSRDHRGADGSAGNGMPAANTAGTGKRFAAGMPLDAAAAGPGLAAALAGTHAGLAALSDDALAGFLGGCQKIAAWAAGMLLEGIAEYAGRRPDDRFPGRAALYAAAAPRRRGPRASPRTRRGVMSSRPTN